MKCGREHIKINDDIQKNAQPQQYVFISPRLDIDRNINDNQQQNAFIADIEEIQKN
jgi:hypothetical protein